MLNQTWFSNPLDNFFARFTAKPEQQPKLIWLASAFLVSVPVFFQAPLVRLYPWASLAMTSIWVVWGWQWHRKPDRRLWGDLLMGFSWSWLAGSLYWGWLRHEPFYHLPVESIGLPFVWWCHRSGGKFLVGGYFFLGSWLGTALTDLYFYVNRLLPYWRSLMQMETTNPAIVLHQALEMMATPSGILTALLISTILLVVGIRAGQRQDLHWLAYGGAVLSTLLVDGCFWLLAIFA